MKSVLVVATSRQTRGGITAVVNAHSKGVQWSKYHIKWIGAYVDRSNWMKILIFLRDKIFWKSVAEVSGHFPGG